MKHAKRSIAVILATLMLLSLVFPGMTLASTAEADVPEGDLTEVYASDLQSIITKAQTGWSGYPVAYDYGSACGTMAIANGGNPIAYEKGIAVHAPSEIVFNIEGLNVVKFSAYVGMEDSLINNSYKDKSDTTFYVYADGEQIAVSPYTTYNSEPYYMEVEIPAGTKTVTLSNDQGDHTESDHTVWADAKFYFAPEGSKMEMLTLADSYTVRAGETTSIAAGYIPSTAIPTAFTYTVGDTTIAKVNEKGVVSGIRQGVTTITVRNEFSDVEATAQLRVTQGDIIVYASDLRSIITKDATGWYGYPTSYNKDPNGGTLAIANNGNPVVYEKGIATHAPADIVFNVKGLNITKFSAYVGMEDSLLYDGYKDYADTYFHILADDTDLLVSPHIKYADAPYYMEVEIPAGTETVTLRNDTGDSGFSDHTVWADAKFTFSSAEGGLGITELALDKDSYTLEVNGAATVTAIHEANVLATNFVWEIADKTVATLLPDGRIFGLKAGTTTLTVVEQITGLFATAEICVEDGALQKNDVWTIQDENQIFPPVYDSEKPNQIELTLAAGDYTTSSAHPQLLLTSAPDSENFAITVKLTGGMSTNYHSAGLIVYVEQGKAVYLERRHHSYNGGNVITFATWDGGYTEYPVLDTAKDAPVYLKLAKAGNVFTAYYKYEEDGEWAVVTTAQTDVAAEIVSDTVANAETLYVGLTTRYGSGVSPIPPTLTVTFSDFTIDGATVPFMVKEEIEITLDSLSAVEAITTVQTGSLTLPATVMGTLSDGSQVEIPVTWNTEGFTPGVVGSYTLTATVAEDSEWAGSDLTTTVTVTVTERTSFDLTGDGVLSIRDVTMLLFCLQSDSVQLAGDPDVNFDGTVNIGDITTLLTLLAAE